MKKTKVVIGQLGSPETPKISDVRVFLKKFLGDPRVVDINPFLWKLILNLFVLPFRPKKSAKAYSRIWEGDGFPLVKITHDFANKLQTHFDKSKVEVEACFLVTSPRPKDLFGVWAQEDVVDRAQKVLVLSQFPQYSESTIASVFDNLAQDVEGLVNLPDINFISSFHLTKAFIENYARKINETIEQTVKDKGEIDSLLVSFHGIPLRRVIYKKDVYYQHCYETYVLLKERVKLDESKFHFVFQSRFGSEQWLGPDAEEYAVDLAKDGHKNILVVCPSFTVDCLETTDEIAHEMSEAVEEHGGHIVQVPCLNADEQWVSDYANYIKVQIEGTEQEKDNLECHIDRKKVLKELPEQVEKSPALTKAMKSTLMIVCLSVFLDLIGFSIIFPLFPQMAKYYLEVDADNYFLKLIWESINLLTNTDGDLSFRAVVLFGGILGAIYSFLQFLSAPLWGSLSDKIGRKPVMLFTVFGLFISYVMWFFSASFSLLILARLIGGLMGGNLSTATAIVSDITDEKRRSKAMAFIGISFAFGFIFGPAIGGILSLFNFTEIFPSLIEYGVNPFSAPAFIAGILSLINLFLIKRRLPETLKADNNRIKRTINPFEMFKPFFNKGVNLTNFAYFLFIAAFSGMEFTLTFLAVERLNFSSLNNGMMFIFIGFVIALVQGGYVRRKAAIVGEQKVARNGLITIIPGLVILSFANSTFLLLLGLFFLSTGSAMVIPCLTSLVSFYAPKEEQGKALGIFRSLGSLGRVIGPICVSLAYWKYGGQIPYIAGALSLILPILLVSSLPKRDQ